MAVAKSKLSATAPRLLRRRAAGASQPRQPELAGLRRRSLAAVRRQLRWRRLLAALRSANATPASSLDLSRGNPRMFSTNPKQASRFPIRKTEKKSEKK